METIRLVVQGDSWVAYFDDGFSIATSFLPEADMYDVVNAMYRRNPGCRVIGIDGDYRYEMSADTEARKNLALDIFTGDANPEMEAAGLEPDDDCFN